MGTKYLLFVDKKRIDPFYPETKANREVTVRVWYPAKKFNQNLISKYLKNPTIVIKELNFPQFYSTIETHSAENIPLSNDVETFPVLIYNHGWCEHFGHNTILMEELASHGYIIFSIAHHCEAKFSFYPDEKFISKDFYH
ncbi:MAG: hypothetical protein KAX49_13485 [Halanaerobiales bacterium]|nr:hypothetical protein [Halanaerobiales bacterium]